MLRTILKYGAIAGVVVGGFMFATFLGFGGEPPMRYAMLLGYATMLLALSAVFVGVKRHRDVDRGGVIGFWPALAVGLGISVIAGVFYVVAWEGVQAVMHMDFATSYGNAMLEQARARGAGADEIARMTAELADFKVQYADPLFRLPMTFAEIFPVGVLVALLSAALLRNPRFLPMRRA